MTRRSRPAYIAVLAAIGLSLAVAPGAGDSRQAGAQEPALAWPPEAPRVRFVRSVEPRRGKLVGILRKIAGVRQDASAFARPYGAAWLGDDLLVTDPGAGRVLRLSPRGRIVATHDGMSGPLGIATCGDAVVVTDSRTGDVVLLSPQLDVRGRLAEGLERPTGVACSGGRVFVVETGRHRVLVLGRRPGAAPAEPVESLGQRGEAPGSFNFPAALATDGDSLWVGDTLNFRLQYLDATDGSPIGTFGRLGDAPGEMPRIKGVTLDRAGQLWVTDGHLDQVSLYGTDGSFLMALGVTGSGPGEFSFPAGVAASPDGRVAVVDSLNRRVQIFELVGGSG